MLVLQPSFDFDRDVLEPIAAPNSSPQSVYLTDALPSAAIMLGTKHSENIGRIKLPGSSGVPSFASWLAVCS